MNSVEELDTPAVTIRVDIMEDNIRRVQAYLDQHGIANRPHIKQHIRSRSASCRCRPARKASLARSSAKSRCFRHQHRGNILLTFNIVGTSKLERLMALSKRLKRLAVVLDSEAVARGLSDAARSHGTTVPFLVECDTGLGRNGVQTPQAALDVARAAMKLPEHAVRRHHDVPLPISGQPGLFRGNAAIVQARRHRRARGVGRRYPGDIQRAALLPYADRAPGGDLSVQRRHDGLPRAVRRGRTVRCAYAVPSSAGRPIRAR